MLTPHQQEALRLARHLSVTANAGSGKTRVLVERYCTIVRQGDAAVGEVVALTYTEKAAGELRRRIADQIASELASASDPRSIARLEEIREQLPAAFIGTIHSFCARILREYPVEAGIDAAFVVLEGLDQSLLLDEAIRETFRALLRTETKDAEKEALLDAIRIVGRAEVLNAVHLLVEQRDRFSRLTGEGLYSGTDQEILARWHGEFARWIAETCAAPNVLRAFGIVCNAMKEPRGNELRAGLAAAGDERSAQALFVATSLRDVLTTGRTVRKNLLRKGAGEGFPAAEEIVGTAFREVQKILPGLLDRDGPPAPELLAISRVLLRTAGRCIERYEEKKAEGGRLDFEDLLLKARTLFTRTAVREALSRRFRFVMVDEYQDTNELQYALLRPLLNNLSTGNLFIVGDPKQSIYRFRNAEVAVFDRTCRDLEANGGARVNLGESFRPLRDLAAFVNLLFSPLMVPGDREAEYEVQYDPLVRARPNPAPGRVEILVGPPREAPPVPEPTLIAREILDLLRREVPVYSREETPRPARPGDIAILLRSRTRLPEIELALTNHQIPYLVSGGIGFYETQDTLDFYNYLQFLENPTDDVALTGILRSPFFAVSDVDLFEAAVHGRRGSFWSDLRRLRSEGLLPALLENAIAALEEDLALCRRLPVTEILSRIVGQRLYRAVIAGSGRGPQAEANLQKLLEIAAAFELPGFTTLFDFTRRLRQQIDAKEQEGQGAIAAGGNAVQIMTIHAAKGLEFPIVIIPSLHRRFRHDSSPYLDDRLGLAFSRRSDEGKRENYPLTELLAVRDRRQTIAEEKRIFYVACTRARDLLVLSGDTAAPRGGESWMAWLLDVLAPGGELSPGPLVLSARTPSLLFREGSYRTDTEEHELTLHVVHPDQGIELVRNQEGPLCSTPIPALHPEIIPGRGKGEIFSATKIKTYRECPARYYYQYQLGLPQESGWSGRGEELETADREIPAEVRGRVFHAVMEEIDRHPDEEAEWLSRIRKELVRETLPDEPRIRDLSAELLAMVHAVTQSPFWKEVGEGSDARTEFTISSILGDDYLTGTMDRIYRDPSGMWHVLDYKTDRVDEGNVEARADAYWPQLEFYALLLCRFYDLPGVAAEILFTALPQQPRRRIFSRGDLDHAEREIASVIARIRGGEIAPIEPPCAGCPFADACRWKIGRE